MGSLPRVTSRNGILTFTITDLHVLDAYILYNVTHAVWHSVVFYDSPC